MSMRVVKPLTITDSMLVSTDVPETEYPVWDPSVQYTDSSSSDQVVQYDHRVFALLKASSMGDNPLERPDVWEEVGATNPWKMFDPLTPVGDRHRTPMKLKL